MKNKDSCPNEFACQYSKQSDNMNSNFTCYPCDKQGHCNRVLDFCFSVNYFVHRMKSFITAELIAWLECMNYIYVPWVNEL